MALGSESEPPADTQAPDAQANTADPAAEAFLTRCSGCHTLGGGKLKGPDLLPATQWQRTDLSGAVKRMEKQVGALGDAEVKAFVDLLLDHDVRKRLEDERKRSVAEMAARMDAPDPRLGERLFWGEAALSAGGMPCGACHRIGNRGGSLGPDLTTLGTKMSRVALMSAIEKANFDVMRAAYAKRPVTKQEALHMAAYFEGLDASVADSAGGDAPWVAPAGAGLALLILIVLGFAFRNRGPAGVRARLVRQALQGSGRAAAEQRS